MESNVSDCFTNITIEKVQTTALAIGIPGIVCLLFSIVGLVAELVFLCRIKNNFLLRLFLYLSVAVSISVGMFSLHLYPYWDQINKPFCAIIDTILYYSFTVEQLLIFSINITLLYKVYSSVFRPCCMQRWTDNITKSCYKIVEVLFVVIHFGIPVIAASILIGLRNPDDLYNWTFCHTQSEKQSLATQQCNDETFLEKIFQQLVPVLANLILSIVCITVLLIWLIWVQSRHFLRARTRTVTKEIGLWLGYLISYCFFWTMLVSLEDFQIIVFPLYPIAHIATPISFFVYMCVNLRHRGNKFQRATEENIHINPQTSGLQTAPPSTRISLPSDTAAHAPNFLSPEEISEVTPLTNN